MVIIMDKVMGKTDYFKITLHGWNSVPLSGREKAQYKDKRHSTFTGGCGVVRGFGELFLEMFAWLSAARWH